MNNENWLNDLYALIQRFLYMGIDADIASLTVTELWGLYLYLKRLGGE